MNHIITYHTHSFFKILILLAFKIMATSSFDHCSIFFHIINSIKLQTPVFLEVLHTYNYIYLLYLPGWAFANSITLIIPSFCIISCSELARNTKCLKAPSLSIFLRAAGSLQFFIIHTRHLVDSPVNNSRYREWLYSYLLIN